MGFVLALFCSVLLPPLFLFSCVEDKQDEKVKVDDRDVVCTGLPLLFSAACVALNSDDNAYTTNVDATNELIARCIYIYTYSSA